jgi:hypothetical protein
MIAKSHRLFSDRLSQNRQRRSSDTTSSQITSEYLASFDRQNVIANLAIKERKIAESI